MRKRRIAFYLCLVLLLSLLSGCGKSPAVTPSEIPSQGSEMSSENGTKPSETEEPSTENNEPKPSEQESDKPEPSKPEPSEPEPSEPEPSEPQSSEPESGEPESSEPESSEPESSEPESGEPESSEPESSEPESGEPESGEPESNEPESSESESSEPESSEPESSEPESSEPESSEPNDSKLTYEEIVYPTIPNTDGLTTAKEIVNKIIKSGMSDFEKVLAIHDWLTFNIDYDYTFTHYYAKETFKDRVAVCQGYAYAFREMCEAAGLETTIVGGTGTNSSGTESHAWNQVKIDDVWYNVDVTWDDPSSGSDKNPDDHSANGYDYFLVSDDVLYKNHTASMLVEGDAIHTCSKDYDRIKIYKKAVESGLHKDIVFASSSEELEAAVLKYMKGDREGFWLWYYDASMTNYNQVDIINGKLFANRYPARVSYFYPLKGAIAKVYVEITPVSKWNQMEVVHDVNEFLDVLVEKGDAGINEYSLLYEATSGTPEVAAKKYRAEILYVPYNDGKCWIVTVNIIRE